MYRQRGGGGAGEECSDDGLGEGVGVLVRTYVGRVGIVNTSASLAAQIEHAPRFRDADPTLGHG